MLSKLVRHYHREFGSRLKAYLDQYGQLDCSDTAIKNACLGWDGKIHAHQRRVGRATLSKAHKKLLRHQAELEACETFSELIATVKKGAGSIQGFGVLAVYDTALRLGAFYDRWPELVYVHAGTRKGCKAVGVEVIDNVVEIVNLPKPLQGLEPYQAEDFLCIFKNHIGKANDKHTDRKKLLPESCYPSSNDGC